MPKFKVHGVKTLSWSIEVEAEDFYDACDIADNLSEQDFIDKAGEANEYFNVEIEEQSMKTFKLEIQEILSKVIEIEAETLSDALDIAHDMYNSEKIVLDASDFVTNTIEEYTT